MKAFVLVNAGVLLLACGRPGSDAPRVSASQDTTEQQPAVVSKADSALPALYEAIMASGDTRSTVRAHFGVPRGAWAQATPNRHNTAQTDTAVHWTFEDLEFWFLVSGGQDFLFETRVLARHATIADRIHALTTPARAEALFGRPSWSQQSSDTTIIGYAIPQDEPGVAQNAVKFYYVGGQLRAVGAAPYVD